MAEAREAVVFCPGCGTVMAFEGRTPHPEGKGPVVEAYECPATGCGRHAAVLHEPEAAITEEQRSWVERVVASKGSFFPTDWYGDGGPR